MAGRYDRLLDPRVLSADWADGSCTGAFIACDVGAEESPGQVAQVCACACDSTATGCTFPTSTSTDPFGTSTDPKSGSSKPDPFGGEDPEWLEA